MPYLNTDNMPDNLSFLGDYSRPIKREEEEQPATKPAQKEATNPFGTPRSGKAFEDLQKVQAERPTKPKPSLWRTLAAIGTGFGTGYANAGGRIKPTAEPDKVMRAIGLGDYDERVANWEDRVKQAQGNFNAASDLDKTQLEYLTEPVKQENLRAQTATMNANLAAKTQPIRDEVDKSEIKEGSDGFYQVMTYKDGRTVTSKLNIPFAEKEKAATGSPVEARTSDGRSVFIQRNPKNGNFEEVPGFAPPPKEAGRTGMTPGEMAADARAKTADKVAAEQRKANRLAALEDKFAKSLIVGEEDRPTATGMMKVPVKREVTQADTAALRAAKQQIQADYENELRQAGVHVDHFEYPNSSSDPIGVR